MMQKISRRITGLLTETYKRIKKSLKQILLAHISLINDHQNQILAHINTHYY